MCRNVVEGDAGTAGSDVRVRVDGGSMKIRDSLESLESSQL